MGDLQKAASSPQIHTTHYLFRLLAGMFFLSGFCALLYQVIWQRLLGLFTGSDVRSVTIVIGAYLAGLGIGNLIGSLVADRLASRRAVQAFALCNFGIALYAFLSKLIFYDLLFLRLHMLASSPWLTLCFSFISLLLPTTLMGLTLPFLSRALARNLERAAELIGNLEGANILGAACGTLLGGWVLVGNLGFDRAAYLGGLFSTLVGCGALLVARSFPADDRPVESAGPGILARAVPRHVWIWCAMVAVSGFVSISLEVLWFRLLNIIFVSQAYTFTQLLAFLLAGYAIGAFLGARWLERIRDPQRAFFLIQGLVMLYALLSVLALVLIRQLVGTQINALPGRFAIHQPGENHLFVGLIAIPALLLLPPNILIGLTIPLVQKAVQTASTTVGQRVGLSLMATVIGNTIGSILTGLVLLDVFGTAGTLRLLSVIGMLFVLLLLWRDRRRARQYQWGAWALLGALLLVTLLFPGNKQLWARLHGGTQQNVVVAEDSTGVTAIVVEHGIGKFYADGALHGTIPFVTVHPLLGALPALIHPNPEELLLIGIGSAGTPYGAGLNPVTKRITAIELIGSEMPVLREFAYQPQGQVLQIFFSDPRYELVVGDGRRELALTERRFDIIQADAIHPWRSHSGLLYSREFFDVARSKLKAGGMMAQWIPTPRTFNTFMQSFPHGVRLADFIALGSEQPVTFDRTTLLRRLEDPQIQAHLQRGGIDIAEIRTFIETAEVLSWSPETPRQGPMNTDLWPQDEYFLNR